MAQTLHDGSSMSPLLRHHFPLVAVWSALLPSAVGCGSDGAPPGPQSDPESGYFESSANNGGPGKSEGAGAPAAGPNLGASDDAGGAEREIAEADIIQLQGTTLYAMSRTGGLSLIDVSNPSALKILGRYRTSFTPFEMYVKDDIVYAMYSDWGQFVLKDGTKDEWVWKQTSQLLALDASDPAHIAKISEFEMLGEISDSRLVGDVLYAVSYQNGSCWGCDSDHPSTNVMSINIARPEAPAKVDELIFEDESPEYGWGKRSISVTPERIYIAGPEYGYQQPESSTIQVVDISDPQGDLEAGTSFQVKGQITSRWQMDELDGTLRVISQPWTWWNNDIPPALETFTVTSSQQIDKLAHLDIILPEREQLRSVRFDGTRGYAVTAVQQDPLFTFDISDPSAPKQMGELHMPGFLYHMEPRGDRLLALGYDQGNGLGAITVSLFDVSNLAQPTMLQRVNFGGSWAQLPEDQDRIHKVFKIDAENSAIFVPFSGWQADDASYCGKSLNGVQIMDYAGDELTLRGMVASVGQARRAFIAGGALFTVAEQEVAAYDISNRDQPEQLSGAPIALNVSLTLPTGDQLVRLRQDWYSESMRLEVVSKDSADAMVASTSFDLTQYLRDNHGLSGCRYWYPSNEPLFTVGSTVWALINDYGSWEYDGSGYSKGRALLVGFSPDTGEVTGSLEIPFQAGYWGWSNTSRVVKGDAVLLMQEGWDQDGNQRSLAALDLSKPAAPRLAYSVALPADDYYGSTGLLDSGSELVTSYARSVLGKDGVVRHFALRIDVSDPLRPTLIGQYNVPGYLVDFDAEKAVAVTLDHQPRSVAGTSYEECSAKLPTSYWDGNKTCIGYSATLNRVSLAGEQALVLDSARMDELAWATPRRGDSRLFFTNGGYGGYSTGGIAYDSIGGYYGWSWSSQHITVVDSATLQHGTVEAPGVWNSLPNGKSLILAPSAGQPLTVIDGTEATEPALLQGDETALGYTNHLSVSGKDVFLSQGDGGVQHMTLP
jgi:hypothetical protein